mmetsp:Transcript_16090/g.41105  ORF Transcript_16090/g.41105 Transcript_16090/m.41105 type:complete len:678 (+) Transcript_16090:112-2145(+)|eukprot:jgi/Tetstr1/431289/TSEL_020983.t1
MGPSSKKEKKERKEKKAERRDRDDDGGKSRKRQRDREEERRRAEKLAKKVAKQLKKEKGAVAGYTDEENPFGDTQLSDKFVWNKKLEKQIQEGTDVREFSAAAERLRQEERVAEIEKVKKRRHEREEEKARMEEELAFIERQRSLADASQLEKKEEEFHLEQAKVRSDIRLREGRAKPVDLLAKNLHMDPTHYIHLPVPYEIFENISLEELKDLEADIGMHQELDVQEEEHKEFWDCLMTVCKSHLAEAARRDEMDRAHMRGETITPAVAQESGLHVSIDADLGEMMRDKSHGQLLELDEDIQQQLQDGECADPEYWEAVRRRLQVYLAKARLRDIHYGLQQAHRAALEGNIPAAMGWDLKAGGEEGDAKAEGAPRAEGPPREEERPSIADIAAMAEERLAAQRLQYDPATMSPKRVSTENLGKIEIVDEEDDLQLLHQLRAQVEYHASGKFKAARLAMPGSSGTSDADAAYRRMLNPSKHGPVGVPIILRNLAESSEHATFRSGQEPALEDEEAAHARRMAVSASKIMGDDAGEAQFSVEANLASQVYWWHDKYRPRKPKYFNRVHTGYEWNKYNQTHYDHDNPPPKTVQGYKFNIFYPDLIDKQKAPTYKLEKDPSSPDGQTCVLRFSAGPPYEDIAFKIVNKQWEYAHKKGFKCSFERGIMHLYFNFQRPRYRR